jgi:hypothetical protein
MKIIILSIAIISLWVFANQFVIFLSPKTELSMPTRQLNPYSFSEEEFRYIDHLMKNTTPPSTFKSSYPTKSPYKKINEFFKVLNKNDLSLEWRKAFLYFTDLYPNLIRKPEEC